MESAMKKTGGARWRVVAVNAMWLVMVCSAIESPQYTVVHSESDFEIRLYRSSVWMSAPALDISFEKATWNGFHRLFQFIQGANLNFSRIPMTAPVLTSMVPGAGPLQSQGYYVSLYLPVKFQANPPLPLPELNIKPYEFNSHCVAVRRFSGFAKVLHGLIQLRPRVNALTQLHSVITIIRSGLLNAEMRFGWISMLLNWVVSWLVLQYIDC